MMGTAGLSKKKKKAKRKQQQQQQQRAAEAAAARGGGGGDASSGEGSGDELPTLNERGFDEEELGFTGEDLDACLRVVQALGGDLVAFKSAPFRELRGALHPLIEEQMKGYDVKGAGGKRRRGNNGTVEPEAPSLKELDKVWKNKTALRAKRLAALEELNAATGAVLGPGSAPLMMITHKGEVDEAVAKLREQQQLALPPSAVKRVPDGVAELAEDEERAAMAQAVRLNIPIQCYICKRPFVDLHFFYDQLCPACAELNYRKRNERADMVGCVAIVTGARVKIGYRCALKLLRCGCTVIATSRFATDCARRFAKEADSDVWLARLQCYGIDFRDLGSLELFCDWVKKKYSRLDAIVNNACQTIRRPAQYYSHLMRAERVPLVELGEKERDLLAGNQEFRTRSGVQYLQGGGGGEPAAALPGVSCGGGATVEVIDEEEQGGGASIKVVGGRGKGGTSEPAGKPGGGEEAKGGAGGKRKRGPEGAGGGEGAVSTGGGGGMAAEARRGTAAEMSQMVVLEEDAVKDGAAFPEREMGGAVLDVNEQQVDLRRHNSWVLKLHEVSTGELAEVMAINSIAPAIINARLKPLLEASPARYKFVVNVSAMEGKFYRWKSDQHPHTNMAKAALNMMTRTCAQDYVKSRIYMTAVDTGWINDEKPIEQAVGHEETHNFQTPLDEIDAAARVLDPIIAPLLAAEGGSEEPPPYGVFLKDFAKCEW